MKGKLTKAKGRQLKAKKPRVTSKRRQRSPGFNPILFFTYLHDRLNSLSDTGLVSLYLVIGGILIGLLLWARR